MAAMFGVGGIILLGAASQRAIAYGLTGGVILLELVQASSPA